MKSITKKAALAALLIALSSSAMAGGVVTATIYRIYVNAVTGLVLVKVNGTVTGRPACATSTSWDFGMTLPTTTSPVRDTLALLMTAHVATRSVTFTGSGTCTAYSTSEDITNSYMY